MYDAQQDVKTHLADLEAMRKEYSDGLSDSSVLSQVDEALRLTRSLLLTIQANAQRVAALEHCLGRAIADCIAARDDSVFVAPNIHNRYLTNATEAYARGAERELVLALVSSGNGGRTGLVITDARVYSSEDLERTHYPFVTHLELSRARVQKSSPEGAWSLAAEGLQLEVADETLGQEIVALAGLLQGFRTSSGRPHGLSDDRLVEVAGESLAAVRHDMRRYVPDGLCLVAHHVLADAEPGVSRAEADTTGGAFRRAERQLPDRAVILTKKEVRVPARRVLKVRARDAQGARDLAVTKQGPEERVGSIDEVSGPRGGVLGIGRRLGEYDVTFATPSSVEIAYRQQARVLMVVGTAQEQQCWTEADTLLAESKGEEFREKLRELSVETRAAIAHWLSASTAPGSPREACVVETLSSQMFSQDTAMQWAASDSLRALLGRHLSNEQMSDLTPSDSSTSVARIVVVRALMQRLLGRDLRPGEGENARHLVEGSIPG